MSKIAIFTLGCKVNLYDSDAMLAVFRQAGFEVAEGLERADVYVLNTCAVTAEAEKKSRQAVSRILKLNPAASIFVCGCASQKDPAQFDKDGVIYVGGTDGKVELARRIVDMLSGGDMPEPCRFTIGNAFEYNDGVVNMRTRHFIKVQDGCNNFCSYCIVPYLRGRSRSRSIEDIIRELDGVCDDVKEVVLSGVNLSAYGLERGESLAMLIRALGKYDFRIRLGSLEVNVIDEELLDAMTKLKRFCAHFHLSLQSGDNDVLKSMNRRYTSEEYMRAVELIRTRFPFAAITTDIIVGFPTETETAFENCLDFARRVGFADIHVFPYSSRKGTVAGKLKPISPQVMSERVERMTALKGELNTIYRTASLGKEAEVLLESKENGLWVGHTEYYVKAYVQSGERNELKTIVPTSLFKDGVKA